MRAPSRAAFGGSALAVLGSFLLRGPSRPAGHLPRWVPWAGVVLGTSVAANEVGGKPVPFLRWSVLRLALGSRHLAEHWQVGDGREQALADYVLARARPGDVDDAIRVIDEFCYRRSLMINVGDEKGAILDRAVQRVQPTCVLELGTYCGYSALRIVRMLPPQARLISVEFSPANADIARRLLQHAGVADVVGQSPDRMLVNRVVDPFVPQELASSNRNSLLVHYPVPVHLQPAYRGRVALGPSGCVATERAAAEVLSLPMYPELGEAEVSLVTDALTSEFNS